MAPPKKTYLNLIFPTGVAAFAHLYKPDDKAPDGASWKPDNKVKTSIVYDDATLLDQQREAILAKLRAEFPGVQDDDFHLPFETLPDNHKTVDLRGKTRLIAKTQPERWFELDSDKQIIMNAKGEPRNPAAGKIVDSKNRALPRGVEARSGDLIRLRATVNTYSKTEEVTVKENGKTRKENVTNYGANLWLNGVQLIEKRATGSGGGFDEVDGGYDGASASDSYASSATAGHAASPEDENADF